MILKSSLRFLSQPKVCTSLLVALVLTWWVFATSRTEIASWRPAKILLPHNLVWFRSQSLRYPCPAARENEDLCNTVSVFTKKRVFTENFRKFQLGCKRNTTFWFVPLEIFRNKRNFWKGSPVFPVETSQWKCVPFTDFSSLSPVPYLSRSFKRSGLPRLSRVELLTNGTRSSQTEIPNGNFPNFFVNWKRPVFQLNISLAKNIAFAIAPEVDKQWARSIRPKFPKIPAQNQMEQKISGNSFRKFRSTSRGCPFFWKFGNFGNFPFHLTFLPVWIGPSSSSRAWKLQDGGEPKLHWMQNDLSQ